MQFLEIFVQVISTGLLLVLSVVMIRRRLHREYPDAFCFTERS
jgi:hypothetical protein